MRDVFGRWGSLALAFALAVAAAPVSAQPEPQLPPGVGGWRVVDLADAVDPPAEEAVGRIARAAREAGRPELLPALREGRPLGPALVDGARALLGQPRTWSRDPAAPFRPKNDWSWLPWFGAIALGIAARLFGNHLGFRLSERIPTPEIRAVKVVERGGRLEIRTSPIAYRVFAALVAVTGALFVGTELDDLVERLRRERRLLPWSAPNPGDGYLAILTRDGERIVASARSWTPPVGHSEELRAAALKLAAAIGVPVVAPPEPPARGTVPA